MNKIYLLRRLESSDTLDPPLPLRPYTAVFSRQTVRASLSFVTEFT